MKLGGVFGNGELHRELGPVRSEAGVRDGGILENFRTLSV